MIATELASLSMSELRSMCAANSIEVTGDKRSKSTYINAIESFQSSQTVIETTTPDPFEDGYEFVINPETVSQSVIPDVLPIIDKSDNMTTPSPVFTTQRGASIVVLVITTILLSLLLILEMGLRSLIPLIAAVVRLSVAIWGFSNREDVPTSFVLISSAQS